MTDKVSVKEIADELGIASKDVLEKAKNMGIEVKAAQSKVSMEEAEKIANYIMNGEDERNVPALKPTIVKKAKDETPAVEPIEKEVVTQVEKVLEATNKDSEVTKEESADKETKTPIEEVKKVPEVKKPVSTLRVVAP